MKPKRICHSDMTGATKAAQNFLQALDNLDWELFREFIADDATVFMPFRHVARRLNGKKEIESAFESFFNQVRQERDGPPYLHIHADDVRVQHFGDIALVTFHLFDVSSVSRRTIIFLFRGNHWRMIHLHASELISEEPSRDR